MNLFYTAANLADIGTKRGTAIALSITAAMLDPTYQTRLKVGLVARVLFGRDWLKRLHSVVR